MHKILFVEGDEAVRKLLGRVLETAGYSVFSCSAREAAQRFRVVSPDLVLLDLTQPEGESGKALDDMASGEALVPVIVTTGCLGQPKESVRQKVSAFMEKPLDPKQLLQTIENLLQKSVQSRGLHLMSA